MLGYFLFEVHICQRDQQLNIEYKNKAPIRDEKIILERYFGTRKALI